MAGTIRFVTAKPDLNRFFGSAEAITSQVLDPYGYNIGSLSFGAGGWESASIRMLPTGKVEVLTGTSPHGQGHETAFPQIAADELGADWRTIAIEPAPLNSAYANPLFGEAIGGGAVQATGFSSTIRNFAAPVRAAAAAARALLSQAAGARWDADWLACTTEAGFVVRGNDRLRFGEGVP